MLGSVAFWYYEVQAMIGFFYYLEVQWFDTPVEGTLEEDIQVYTLANFLDYPARKAWLYEMVAVMGLFSSQFPISNLLTMPALGLAAYYNELY